MSLDEGEATQLTKSQPWGGKSRGNSYPMDIPSFALLSRHSMSQQTTLMEISSWMKLNSVWKLAFPAHCSTFLIPSDPEYFTPLHTIQLSRKTSGSQLKTTILEWLTPYTNLSVPGKVRTTLLKIPLTQLCHYPTPSSFAQHAMENSPEETAQTSAIAPWIRN